MQEGPSIPRPLSARGGAPAGAPALIAAALAVAVLLAASRGAPLGVPAADDYFFLHRQRFGPLDLFDSFGAAWYWRPLSRQLYFTLLGPWLLAWPALVAIVHAALLVATGVALASLVRRTMPMHAAIVAATTPILVESARVLLAWPSAAQHLIAMAAVSAALAWAAGGRMAPALGAAVAGLCSLESAALALPLLPILAPRDAGAGRRRWIVATLAIGLAWIAARLAVASRGVIVPSGPPAPGPAQMLDVLRLGLVAQLGLEDLPPAVTATVIAGYAIAGVGAWWTSRRAGATGAPRSRTLLAWGLGGVGWWVATTLPLVAVLPNWNAWRTGLPGLGLAVSFAALFGRGAAWPAACFVVVRIGALWLAAPAPSTIVAEVPQTVSHMSFVRLVRLQRTLEATRTTLVAGGEAPRGVRIRYWAMPELCEFGFADSRAVQVWLGDSTARWAPFGGDAGFRDLRSPVIAFNPGLEPLAVWIAPQSQRLLARADVAAREERLDEADALLSAALAAQRPPAGRLSAVVLGNRATLSLRRGDFRLADSLHHASRKFVPRAEWLQTEQAIAIALGDSARARRASVTAAAGEVATRGAGARAR